MIEEKYIESILVREMISFVASNEPILAQILTNLSTNLNLEYQRVFETFKKLEVLVFD